MIIQFIMLIFILVMLITAFYIWKRRKSKFLVFDATFNLPMQRLMTTVSICLVLTSIIGVIILFFNNKYLNLITLVLGSIIMLIFGLAITKINE